MNIASTNVVYITPPSLQEHIESFFRFNSVNTGSGYRNDVSLFFKKIKQKEIVHLKVEDLKINITDLNNFRHYLITSGDYKNITINRKLSAVKSLMEFLSAHEEYKELINIAMFKLIKKLPNDTKHTDILYEDEAAMIAELALEELHNAEEKHALFCLAFETSIRKNALTKIRYWDIRKHRTKTDKMVISSDGIFDKGKIVDSKEISMETYHKIMNLKGDKRDSDLIFTLSLSTIDTTFKRLCDKAGLDKNRKLSMHSCRKTGIQWAYERFGLRAAQMQAGHSSPAVTSASYLEKETNVASDMFLKTNENICDLLTEEELRELIKSCTGSITSIINHKAEQILKNRNEE
jgi:integrase